MLTSTEEVYFKSAFGLAKQLRADGMKVLKPAAQEPGEFTAESLTEVKRSGFRVVFLLSFPASTKSVASIAHKEGMDTGYAWIISYLVPPVPEMRGWLYMRPLLGSEGMQKFAEQVSNYSQLGFQPSKAQCQDRNDTNMYGTTCSQVLLDCEATGITWYKPDQTNAQACPVTCAACVSWDIPTNADLVDLTYSVALHDAIMLYAHAATKVLSEGGNLRDGQAVTEAVRSTTFEGVGNRLVALDQHGDRIESYEVMSYVVGAGTGAYKAQTSLNAGT